MGEFFNCMCRHMYFIIIESQNDYIIMNFTDDGADAFQYEHIYITILDGNVTNI